MGTRSRTINLICLARIYLTRQSGFSGGGILHFTPQAGIVQLIVHGSRILRWNGNELQDKNGSRLLKFTGTEIQDKNGSRLYKVTGTEIQDKNGSRLYKYTATELQDKNGSRLYRTTGPIPVAIFAGLGLI